MATKASDLFVQCLEDEGCEYIFGVPGEENLDMLDSLSRSKTIKLILTRHEQGAGFMAATYGRHTGKTGVFLATLGPGATNMVTAVAYSQLGGMPTLAITGQKPIKKSKQGRFQILDVVQMMGPITKYAHQLAAGDNIPSRVRECFRLAEEEKPGATHLEFPEDIATAIRHLKATLPLLTKHKLAPNPINYGIYYLYASNRSLELRRILDSMHNGVEPIAEQQAPVAGPHAPGEHVPLVHEPAQAASETKVHTEPLQQAPWMSTT